MKKILINILLTILFSLSIISSVISLTILNDDYIKLIFDKRDIYSDIVVSIKDAYKENELNVDFDTDQVKKDVNDYISKRYLEDKEESIYYHQIYFMHNTDLKKYSYMIYSITLILIIITGNVFLHSKKYHSLDMIFLMSSIVIILLTGYVYVFISFDTNILNIILNTTNHVLLGVGVFLLELVFLKYGNILIHRMIKK